MCGPFDYNRMPLAPMGCKVQIHEKPANRGTWDYLSVNGWYLHTSNEHYRTHNCHVKGTRSERLSDTVQFLCKSITNPTKTVADKIMLAISQVSDLIEDKGKTEEAEEAVRELERLVRATNRAQQDDTSRSEGGQENGHSNKTIKRGEEASISEGGPAKQAEEVASPLEQSGTNCNANKVKENQSRTRGKSNA